MGILEGVYSICRDCALANGAIPAEGNCYTVWVDKCPVCKLLKGLADVSDYNWPKGKRPATFSRLRRD